MIGRSPGVALVLIFLFISQSFLFLAGCASSKLSRSAQMQVHDAQQSKTYLSQAGDISPNQAWQNSSQTTKGVVLGGAAGAVAGGLTSGVGVVPGGIGGAIFGGALGALIDSKTTLADRLTNRGVTVMVLGDQIRFVLPSQRVFQEVTSAQLSPWAASTLDLVSQFINQYANQRVSITAYLSDKEMSQHRAIALTNQQANSVMRYLWRDGVNTRLLTSTGLGSLHPIAGFACDSRNDAENNRVEITLEKLPV